MENNSKFLNHTVWENIQNNYANLFSAETKVADFILQNPEKAAIANVSETAELSGVSVATVVRFCKRIGYAGFYEMKLKLSHDMGKSASLADDDIKEGVALKRMLTIVSNISLLSKHIDDEVMKKCADAINNSSTVFVIGNGYTKIIACDVIYRLTRMGIRCSGGGYSETDMENLCMGKENDVAIFFSRSGEDKKTYKEMLFANSKKMITISITDTVKCPLAQFAKYALTTGIEKKEKVFSHNSSSSLYMSVLAEVLIGYVTERFTENNYLDEVISEDRL